MSYYATSLQTHKPTKAHFLINVIIDCKRSIGVSFGPQKICKHPVSEVAGHPKFQ